MSPWIWHYRVIVAIAKDTQQTHDISSYDAAYYAICRATWLPNFQEWIEYYHKR